MRTKVHHNFENRDWSDASAKGKVWIKKAKCIEPSQLIPVAKYSFLYLNKTFLKNYLSFYPLSSHPMAVNFMMWNYILYVSSLNLLQIIFVTAPRSSVTREMHQKHWFDLLIFTNMDSLEHAFFLHFDISMLSKNAGFLDFQWTSWSFHIIKMRWTKTEGLKGYL